MDEETTVTEPEKNGMNPLIIVVIVAVIGIVGYMMFANRPTAPTTEPTTDTVTEPQITAVQGTEATTIVETGDIVTVEMEAGSFYYTPKEIKAKVGQTVRINFKAVDMMHDFNIDELDVDGPVVKSGESTVIEFVASKAGEFEYYCSVGQHRANGQVGTLIVE